MPDRLDPTAAPPAPETSVHTGAEGAVRSQLGRAAQEHYRRGNRFYETESWERALAEWRSAAGMWALARATGRLVRRRLMHLRAALALLLTVLLVYVGIFTFFPRDPFEMFLLSGGGGPDNRSWWQRFLDTGRPQFGEGHKMGVREWWERFQRHLQGNGGDQVARGRAGRPSLDERWEQLLRRYGRWGPFFNYELDYSIISGYGLSRMGDYHRALEVFERAIDREGEPGKLADLYQGLANAHYYEGYRLQPDGLAKYELYFVRRSMQAYEHSVRHQARPVSFGNLGWMYFLLGDYERSAEESRRALQLDAGLEYVRLNLGLTYIMQGRVRDAFDIYRDVIRRNPADDVYLGGINDLREVIRDHPTQATFAHLMVGLLAIRSGDYILAKESLSRFNASPFVGRNWKVIAQRLMSEIDTEEATR